MNAARYVPAEAFQEIYFLERAGQAQFQADGAPTGAASRPPLAVGPAGRWPPGSPPG